MLTNSTPLGLAAFAALRTTSAAELLALAGRALDQTLQVAPEAKNAALVIFSGARFTAAREEEPENPSDGALLDNSYATRLVGELLLERGMVDAQLHGVLLADEAPLLTALRVARSFIGAEGLEHVLVVAIQPPCVAASLLVTADASKAVVTLDGLSARSGPSVDRDLLANIEALNRLALGRPHERLTLVEGGFRAELSSNSQRVGRGLPMEAR